MGNRSRYRKLPELFVQGREVVFDDDDGPVVMWLQVLNPFEMQECRNIAQGARGRVIMAIKTVGSSDYDIARGRYMRLSREAVINELADGKYTEWYLAAQQNIETDPEWAERLVVLRNQDEVSAAGRTPEEEAMLAELNGQYMAEVQRQVIEDRDYRVSQLEQLEDEDLEKEFLDDWTDRRAQSVAMAEFNMAELYWSARICDAVPDDEGKFVKGSHSACNGHRDRVYESPEEVRSLPEEMQAKLRAVLDDLTMSVRDAKNSDRQGSSSDSSPLPSTPEESTPSTPSETSEQPPGT